MPTIEKENQRSVEQISADKLPVCKAGERCKQMRKYAEVSSAKVTQDAWKKNHKGMTMYAECSTGKTEKSQVKF